jgi:c(7)-type cytochrome triheme protein
VGESNFYDPGNPDVRRLQRYEEAVTNLPMDDNGFPDWMRALRESNIQPRTGLKRDAPMNILNLGVIMKNTREMPFVSFPHYAHTLWLDCANCHPVLFEAKAGSTRITMTDIFRGKYCGMCHDRVAFITFFSCQRCHSVPHP